MQRQRWQGLLKGLFKAKLRSALGGLWTRAVKVLRWNYSQFEMENYRCNLWQRSTFFVEFHSALALRNFFPSFTFLRNCGRHFLVPFCKRLHNFLLSSYQLVLIWFGVCFIQIINLTHLRDSYKSAAKHLISWSLVIPNKKWHHRISTQISCNFGKVARFNKRTTFRWRMTCLAALLTYFWQLFWQFWSLIPDLDQRWQVELCGGWWPSTNSCWWTRQMAW